MRGERPRILGGVAPLVTLIDDCWHVLPARRPEFRDIFSTLEALLINMTISDTKAQEFWKRHFSGSVLAMFSSYLLLRI